MKESDFDRITDITNSVGTGFGLGKNIPYSLHTTITSVYRVTGMNQVEDIIECGYVRPKGYGARASRVGDKVYWSQGNDSLCYYDKRPVLEASSDLVYDGKIGAVSINDLSAIWLFDEKGNKYVNKLEDIKSLYYSNHQEESTNIDLNKVVK